MWAVAPPTFGVEGCVEVGRGGGRYEGDDVVAEVEKAAEGEEDDEVADVKGRGGGVEPRVDGLWARLEGLC